MMKFNLKTIVAAVALAASTAAVAQSSLTPMSTQNGSLTFLGLDSSASISILVDLNYNLNDFLPTSAVNNPGTTIVWNFNTNTLTVNGTAQQGTFAWSNPFATFSASANNVQWAVISGDSQTGQRYTTTGNPTQSQLNALTLQSASNMSIVNNLYAANAPLGTHVGGNTAGASVATSGTAYVGGNNFGTAGRWGGNNLAWTAFATEGATNRFQFINVQPRPAPNNLQPTITTFGLPNVDHLVATGPVSTFTYDDGVLTWATPVPEPSTYAMMLAGLAAVGFMTRRRKLS
jgi:hypothetical protein